MDPPPPYSSIEAENLNTLLNDQQPPPYSSHNFPQSSSTDDNETYQNNEGRQNRRPSRPSRTPGISITISQPTVPATPRRTSSHDQWSEARLNKTYYADLPPRQQIVEISKNWIRVCMLFSLMIAFFISQSSFKPDYEKLINPCNTSESLTELKKQMIATKMEVQTLNKTLTTVRLSAIEKEVLIKALNNSLANENQFQGRFKTLQNVYLKCYHSNVEAYFTRVFSYLRDAYILYMFITLILLIYVLVQFIKMVKSEEPENPLKPRSATSCRCAFTWMAQVSLMLYFTSFMLSKEYYIKNAPIPLSLQYSDSMVLVF